MTTTLIRNVTLLPFTPQENGAVDLTPRVADVLLDGDRIAQVGTVEGSARVEIDGTDHLLIPGFVDAHTHSKGVLNKCAYEALPLELWMLFVSAGWSGPSDERLVYLCAAIAGIEALKHGTTTLQDDLYIMPHTTPESYGAAAQAYTDLGLRASLSLHAINKPLHETIPFLGDLLPPELKHKLESVEMLSDDDWIALARQLHSQWQDKGLVSLALAPSAPQRVTPELMHRIGALSEELDLPIHTHALETRTQAITGPQMLGESVISYAKRHGILTHRTTLAHGIWLTDADIELVAAAEATVVHNFTSNGRLCSGIARIPELMQAGVTIGLGSDGTDTYSLFDVIKSTGLIHSIPHPDYAQFPKAADLLTWAIRGGARSTLLHQQIGAIAAGMKADLVLYDLNTLSFIPRSDLTMHLAYAEHGHSIRKVFVDGELVVDRGQVLKVDEGALLKELAEIIQTYRTHRDLSLSYELLKPMEHMYAKAMSIPFETNCFTRSQEQWPTLS